jgi:hypothetical protein
MSGGQSTLELISYSGLLLLQRIHISGLWMGVRNWKSRGVFNPRIPCKESQGIPGKSITFPGGCFSCVLRGCIKPWFLLGFYGESAGARTQDQRLKRAMLYQLSYALEPLFQVSTFGGGNSPRKSRFRLGMTGSSSGGSAVRAAERGDRRGIGRVAAAGRWPVRRRAWPPPPNGSDRQGNAAILTRFSHLSRTSNSLT